MGDGGDWLVGGLSPWLVGGSLDWDLFKVR